MYFKFPLGIYFEGKACYVKFYAYMLLIFCSLMNKAFTAKAVVVCDVKLHRAAVVRLDLGFDVKSCNWCEAALPARINFIKVSTLLLLFPQIYFFI